MLKNSHSNLNQSLNNVFDFDSKNIYGCVKTLNLFYKFSQIDIQVVGY